MRKLRQLGRYKLGSTEDGGFTTLVAYYAEGPGRLGDGWALLTAWDLDARNRYNPWLPGPWSVPVAFGLEVGEDGAILYQGERLVRPNAPRDSYTDGPDVVTVDDLQDLGTTYRLGYMDELANLMVDPPTD